MVLRLNVINVGFVFFGKVIFLKILWGMVFGIFFILMLFVKEIFVSMEKIIINCNFDNIIYLNY